VTWSPERVVDPAEAAGLIGAQFPQLRGAPVEPLATGWDNTVHLVDRRWVFRFPRRAVALPGVEHEIAVLPRLAIRLPLAVPVPEFVGEPSHRYPWPFWGAALIPGRELAEVETAEPAAALGRFLRALHDTDHAALELPHDPMDRGVPAVRAGKARPVLDRLVTRGVVVPSAVTALLLRADVADPPPGPAVLAHGDLHIRHVLVDGAGRATGVIDWGDLCLADPAVDLSLAYGGFAGPARDALLAAYGPVPPERELAARVLAVSLCASLAEYAADEGRTRLLRAALDGLRRAAC
jgi:aminoglycoside phosphotransferase (APT) family kinase protein